MLEVNESPSFNDDTEVDKEVKGGLISDTFRLLNIKPNSKQKIKDNNAKGLLMRTKINHMTSEQIEEAYDKDLKHSTKQQQKHENF